MSVLEELKISLIKTNA